MLIFEILQRIVFIIKAKNTHCKYLHILYGGQIDGGVDNDYSSS